MPELPLGTVTFLFTDIQGSSRLLQEAGEPAYARMLADHHRLLRAAIAAHEGIEVSSQGDGLLAVFRRAQSAAAAAIAAQCALALHAWPDDLAPRVRMGIHTGEPVLIAGEYAGLDVHRGARLCKAAHGGQILVSDAARLLAAPHLPPRSQLRDLGVFRLRDLREAVRIYQLCHPELPHAFPPLSSLPHAHSNLPRQLTRFIGRQREAAELERLLRTSPLVTLVGSGGVGKTRLALHLADNMGPAHADGTWLVDLAPLSDPALLPQAVAAAVGCPEIPGREVLTALLQCLEAKQVLLILDNCEHLAAACAALTDHLLRRCAHVRILATSRRPLGIAGELTWRVPPLALPEAGDPAVPERLARVEAVALFVDRALASQPSFRLTRENAPAVASVCRRLDGLPLAIELAAARIGVLSPEQLAARLDDRFRLLAGGSRTALPRQHTLRGTMDWSYDLLGSRERLLLQQLSVFAGGWSLEAAEAVCSGDGVEGGDVLDGLTELVFQSLVVADEQGGTIRYRCLETVRGYGADLLARSGTADAVRTRHRDWCLAFAERVEEELSGARRGVQHADSFDKVALEHENIRAAVEWSLARGDAEAVLRLVTALREFWFVRGSMAEARKWLEAALGAAGPVALPLRANALRAAGWLAVFGQGDYRGARGFLEESLRLWRGLENTRNVAQLLHDLGSLAAGQGEHDRARRFYEESLALRRSIGDRAGSAVSLHNLGRVAYREGQYEHAAGLLRESLAIWRETGAMQYAAMALTNLGLVACRQTDPVRAGALLHEGLDLHAKLGDTRRLTFCLEGCGLLAAVSGRPAEAVALFGAAEALRESIASPLPPADRPDYEQAVALARAQMAPEAFRPAWTAGRALSLNDALRIATGVCGTGSRGNEQRCSAQS